jgi:hypothetical protein
MRGSSSARWYLQADSTICFKWYSGRQPNKNLALALSNQVEWYDVWISTVGKPLDSAK